MSNSWIAIGSITFLVALGSLLIKPRDLQWAREQRLPKWLFFAPAIPIIWTVIFVCGAASAVIIWEDDPGSLKTWLLMGSYLLLELVTVAYIPLTLRLKSLRVGTIVGATGVIFGILLALAVLPTSALAAGLLLPYLIWSPVGTVTTWRMVQLNPDAA